MNMNLAQSFGGLNAAGRAGKVRPVLTNKLSAADKSGVIYKQFKGKQSKAALNSAPTGLDAMDSKGLTGKAAADKHAQIEAQAKQLVGQTFFGTLMKQMRDSPFKSKLFDGGRGGEAYSSLYDQKLVDQMSRGAGKKLVNSIIRKLEANKAYKAAQPGPAKTATALSQPTAGASPRRPLGDPRLNPNRNVKAHAN